MSLRREWPISRYFAVLLVLAIVFTFGVVGVGVLLVRVPALEAQHRALVEREAQLAAGREEILLQSLEDRLAVLAAALQRQSLARMEALLDVAVGEGNALRALYVVGASGKVEAAGLPGNDSARRQEVLGSDLSGTPIYQAAQRRGSLTWGDKFLSSLTGDAAVGVAVPLDAHRLLLAEVPLPLLMRSINPTVKHVPGDEYEPISIWLVDSNGEVLADTEGGRVAGRLNLLGTPLVQPQAASPAALEWTHDGERSLAAVARAEALNWTFVARTPAGLAHPEVRALIRGVVWALGLTLAVALLMAPWWASHLAATLRALVEQARLVATDAGPVRWPESAVHEVNELSSSLAVMAQTLQQRQQALQAVFNTAPVPMVVSTLGADAVVIDANEAWCRLFGHRRDEIVGRPALQLRLWVDEAQRVGAHEQAMAGSVVAIEARMRHSDGHELLCHVSGRALQLGDRRLMVWADEDITEARRIERDLRELNLGLEQRVQQRTAALEAANEELRLALTTLQGTRSDLQRAEKLASLGSLVAGVAHELNTPLGNSLMAVTTLRDEAVRIGDELQAGLRRSTLTSLLDNIEQATAISMRNLQRAADLLASFKQVAVDQTSLQRRRFDLAAMVQEVVQTLTPSFSRTPYRIVIDVPEGLQIDSYPGALGQVLTNLINNAMVHGFDGRSHGCIEIVGAERGPDEVQLQVRDDGQGIPAALLDRVFDPFVTSRMGRGGTGLGLNIAHNAASHMLGGTLTVESQPGEGARFTLRMPRKAPVTAPERAPE